MNKTIITGALFAALATTAVFGAEMKTMNWRVPLMDKAPVIDGNVDEKEWAAAQSSFGFLQYPRPNVCPVKTRFWVGRTKDRLFLAGIGEIGPSGLAKDVKPRRGNVGVGGQDTYEIVLVPDTSVRMPDIRSMIINFNGAYSTQTLIDNKMAAWIPESLEIKSGEKDGFWHFEWSVLLEEIGFAQTPADKHGIRFCRNVKRIFSQWGFQSSMQVNEHGFFTSKNTVPSVFDDEAIAAQLYEAPNGDRNRWALTLALTNPTAKPAEVVAEVKGCPVNSQPGMTLQKLTLQPGETKTYPVSGPILGDEKVELTLDVKANGRQQFFRHFIWNPNRPAPEWLKVGDDGSAAKFSFAFYPSYNRMRLKADLATIAAAKRPKTVRVELRSDVDKAKDVLAATELELDQEGVADVLWDTPDLKAETLKTGVGGYTITFEAKGVKNGKKTVAFRRDVFEWEGFKGGTSDVVPSSFSPVMVCDGVTEYRLAKGVQPKPGQVVKTVLKDHEIGDFGLWSQVTAAGKPVLARPIRLVELKSKVEVEERNSNDPKYLSSTSTSNLDFSTSWDVDGMMEWWLTLKPGHHEPMTLEIPIRAERAKLFHPCADGMRYNYAGFVPAGEGRVWDSSKSPRTSIIGDYLPYVWIGGALRGISVFGESDRGWVIDPKAHCQEVVREKDGTVVLKLNLVQKAVDLREPRTIHLAFLATPVKPMEKNWRSSPIGGLIGSCYYWGGLTASDEIHPYDGTDTFWRKMAEARRTGKVDKDYIERSIRECLADVTPNTQNWTNMYNCYRAHHNAGMYQMSGSNGGNSKKVWYTNGRGVRLGNPEGTTFADEWTVEPFSSRPFGWRAAKSYSLDPNKSYLDFAAFWWEKALALGVVDYYYWDDIFCQSNFDLVGTESYRTESGEIQPASGIFNQRAQVKRCAVLQAEHGWIDHKNWVHMTNTALAPVLAFAGMNYDWEDVAGDSALQERYPKESMQAQSLGRQFGNRVAVMGYFSTGDKEKLKWLQRTGTGACLVHEFNWIRVKEWQEADRLLSKWGYRDPTTKVWNYFDEDVPFPVAITGGTEASLAMTRRDGGSLVIVSDFDNGGDYVVKPDCAVMGVKPGFKAYNLETGAELPVENGAVKVHLDRLDYVIIELR